MLHGDQRLYGAEAGINYVAVAPVLNYAIRMFIRLIFVSVSVSVLAVGSQTKEAKRAKRVKC
jgi:hypothetical protein